MLFVDEGNKSLNLLKFKDFAFVKTAKGTLLLYSFSPAKISSGLGIIAHNCFIIKILPLF